MENTFRPFLWQISYHYKRIFLPSWLDSIFAVPMIRILFLSLSISLLFSSCAFRRISRHKGIVYQSAQQKIPPQKLNVFAPRIHKGDSLRDVLVFIHGGNWIHGKKELYNWFGSRWARKGVVTIVIDYPLSPAADYRTMTADAATSIAWAKSHIQEYGGNPNRIFVSGHSAGGQLAALIAIDNSWWTPLNIPNPIKGVVLIDAAGIDMYGFLKRGGLKDQPTYIQTFTSSEAEWKRASPLYQLHEGMPPILIYQGGNTFPSIAKGNEKLVAALKGVNARFSFEILPGKKHVPMITQFFNTSSKRYKEMLRFMRQAK